MISSSPLNKLLHFTFFIFIVVFNFTISIAAVDIWEKKEKKDQQNNQIDNDKKITIESPILSDDVKKIKISIDENKIEETTQSVIGIFDPEENNFNLNMWSNTDGE